MKKAAIIATFGAAALGLGVATGFIHKTDEPKTPDECYADLRKGTEGLSLKLAAGQMGLLEFTESPEIKQQHALYADCMERYEQSHNSIISIGFGFR